MIFGIDIGNDTTKNDKMGKFKSRVVVGHKGVNEDDIKIEYKGKKYTVGSKAGTLNLGTNKYFNIDYDICLITAIAKSTPEQNIEAKIVVGLPPELFESPIRDKLEEKINKLGEQEITIYEGTEKIKKVITILNGMVFEESAVVFSDPKEYKKQNLLIIDIGGGSCDITQFDGLELVKHNTTKFGMLTLYTNMKTSLNSNFGNIGLPPEAMEDILGKSTYEINEEVKSVSFLKDTVDAHIREINNVITQNFDTANRKIRVIGGGAKPLINSIKAYYPNAKVLDNAQFLNAITYKEVGLAVWGE
ncbi:hypothetical protein ACJDU8_22360 [Clostridium sp. WILCCON 0269]|uniref:Actin-like protein N-terminal domain-containing protein n=1 Tax=Candidatus Clostridium eludens TaxID=3381663 RepID=A0ABW8SR53_9CLOT